MTVLRRFVRDHRRSLVGWSIGLLGLLLFTVGLFPSVHGQSQYEDLAKSLPESVKSLFSINDAVPLTSAPGYLQGRLFGSLLPVLLLVFAIGLGARTIGGAEQDGTLEMLLSHPIGRRRVLLERAAAAVALLLALGAVFTVMLFALAAPLGALEDVRLAGLAAACAGATLLALVHLAVALLAGAVTGRRGPAAATATAVAAVGYLLQGLLGLVDGLQPLRFLTPWHWFLGRNMLVGGPALEALVVPVLVTAVLVAAASVVFERRDLR